MEARLQTSLKRLQGNGLRLLTLGLDRTEQVFATIQGQPNQAGCNLLLFFRQTVAMARLNLYNSRTLDDQVLPLHQL